MEWIFLEIEKLQKYAFFLLKKGKKTQAFLLLRAIKKKQKILEKKENILWLLEKNKKK
jgi:hypothetical protein